MTAATACASPPPSSGTSPRPPYYRDGAVTVWHGDALTVLRTLPTAGVDCVVTSPPYWGLRDYGGEPEQIGHEPTPSVYLNALATVFAEVHRVLAPTGTLWLNLDDVHAGKANAGATVGRSRRADRAELIPARMNATAEAPYKSQLMLPERLVWLLIEQGWCKRNTICCEKLDGQPESVRDRLTHRYEPLFLLTKSSRYWFDLDAIREPVTSSARARSWPQRRAAGAPDRQGTRGAVGDGDFQTHPQGRNPGDVWRFTTAGFPEAHFAVMPDAMARRCIAAGCRPGGTVLDPFMGVGTTGKAAGQLGCGFWGIELHRPFIDLGLRTQLRQTSLLDARSPGEQAAGDAR